MTTTNKNILYVLLFFAMIGWGASWVNIKILSTYLNEYETMFFRFFITAISMIPIIKLLKKSFRINFKSLVLALFTSIALIAYMKYFYLGTKLGTASLGGALVTSLIPIMTFLILVIFKEKSISSKESIALILGAVGVMTMLNIWSFTLENILLVQNLYFIVASILWAVVTILSSKASQTSPLIFTFYLYIITCILNLIFFVDISLISYTQLDTTFWINMLILSLVASTFSNTIYFIGIEKLGPSQVSSFVFLVPFAAIILSSIFLQETIGISIVLGTVLTLSAVKILNNIKLFRR